MNRTESVYSQDGLSSNGNNNINSSTTDKLKLGEFFYLRRTNRYSFVCVHCYQEFDEFSEFTLHIEQHLLKFGIQAVKSKRMENAHGTGAPTGTGTPSMHLPSHSGYSTHDGMPIFKNEFGQTNANELPQYFYNGYNPTNWFGADGQQPVNNDVQSRKPLQYEEQFDALKRQFNEPMFIINDTPEVRQLSQYLSESFPIEKQNGQYKCPLCDKLFNGSALARRHVYTHSVEKVFACSGCQRKFSHARHLRDHIKSKHGNPANLPDRSTSRISNRSCDLQTFLGASNSHSIGLSGEAGRTAFQQEFDALRGLYQDNKSIIVNDLPEIREISQYLMPNYDFAKINDQVMCPLCDGLFNSKSTVRRHLTNHLKVKMFRCADCEREFRHARHLGEHIKQKHHTNFPQDNGQTIKHKANRSKLNAVKSEPYDTNQRVECYICHMKFKNRRHKSLNDNSRPPCCNNCIREMTKRSSAIDPNTSRNQTINDLHKSHQRHIMDMKQERGRSHKESMKFYCKYCNLGFMEHKSLVMHEMQHTKTMKTPDLNNQMMPVGMHIQ